MKRYKLNGKFVYVKDDKKIKLWDTLANHYRLGRYIQNTTQKKV